MTLSPELLEVVVDPVDKGGLHYFATENLLYNDRTQKKYMVRPNGIAVLLAGEAQPASRDEHERLMKLVTSGNSVLTGGRS